MSCTRDITPVLDTEQTGTDIEIVRLNAEEYEQRFHSISSDDSHANLSHPARDFVHATATPIDHDDFSTATQPLQSESVDKDPSASRKELGKEKGHHLRRPFVGTIVLIIGFFSLALLISIAHYIFFFYLSGRIADSNLAPIRQSYVTASSLVFTTLFRANLLGSVSICFAQTLWRTLRDQPISVSAIESLFQMRSNPFEMANIQLFRSATLAFLIATYMWIVPLAVTFLPGALTIAARPFDSVEQVNASVINPMVTDNFDPLQNNEGIDSLYVGSGPDELLWPGRMYDAWYRSSLPTILSPQVQTPLTELIEQVITTGEISDTLPPYPSRNSSQLLKFMGPQLACRPQDNFFISDQLLNGTSSTFSTRRFILQDLAAKSANVNYKAPRTWASKQLWMYRPKTPTVEEPGPLRVERIQAVGASGCTGNGPSICSGLALQNKTLDCKASFVTYLVNITWTNGKRHLAYEKAGIDPQPEYEDNLELFQNGTISGFPDLSGYKDWAIKVGEILPYYTSKKILDNFIQRLDTAKSFACRARTNTLHDWTAQRGTALQLASIDCDGLEKFNNVYEENPILLRSRLNLLRYNKTTSSSTDPRISLGGLDITESSLNELLTNITHQPNSTICYMPSNRNRNRHAWLILTLPKRSRCH
ncbi:hypothetical protein M3J09_008869 [Ascochyta lentis]